LYNEYGAARNVSKTEAACNAIIFTFFFLPFSPGDAYNTRFFSGILLIRFFCNFSLRTAGNSLFTAFSSGVDFFKVSFFLFFQD